MKSLAAQPPAVPAPLDPGFDPAFLFNRNYLCGVRTSGRGSAGIIIIHVPDEKSRRVGQAVAAASLPKSAKKSR